MTPRNLIARAAAAYGRRDLRSAEQDCRKILAANPGDGEARHLLGLVLRQAGDVAGAEPWLRSSVEILPRRAEFRINFSNLLSALGRLPEAEAELRAALEIEPGSRTARLGLSRLLNHGGDQVQAASEAELLLEKDSGDAEAWAALGDAQRDQGRLEDAESSFRQALALRPDYAVVRHNLGAVLSRLKRADEALVELEHAEKLGMAGPSLYCNRGLALTELRQFDAAEAAFLSAIEDAPGFVEAQVSLAKLRYMRGESDFARSLIAVAAHTKDPVLGLTLGDLLRRAGQLDEAMNTLNRVAMQYPGRPEIQSNLSVLLQERGELDAALEQARAAYRNRPQDPTIVENLVAILLQTGDPEPSMPLIQEQRLKYPHDQRWLTYEATAARLAGSPRYRELYDYERFVMPYNLESPPGFSTIDEFNSELADRLEGLHALETHPLDQSLRQGTQTSRDLCEEPDPVVQAFLRGLSAPIEAYREAIGFDERHPFLARNQGDIELVGCWSVKLGRNGYHVNHIHPEGWISSAYYVDVPPEVEDERQKNGWIKFGEPRMPTPDAGPEYFVHPRAGRLVLFPSYMWHGTTAIHGDARRLTIAFDARPVT